MRLDYLYHAAMKEKNPGSPIAQFVKSARKAMTVTQGELGDLFATSKGNVSGWENGRHEPPYSVLAAISQRSGIPLPRSVLAAGESVPDGYLQFDVLDIEASCGPGIIPSVDVGHEVVQKLNVLESWAMATLGGDLSRIKLITARGTSMSGTIENGDVLFVDVHVREFDGDGIYAVVTADGIHAKRLQRLHDGSMSIISDNKQFEPQRIQGAALDDLIICGRVLAGWSLKKFW